MMPSKENILARLMNRRIVNEDSCWFFTGPSGIIKREIYIDDRNCLVSRISAWIHLDFGLGSDLICHRCNSDGLCWNPEHIYIGNTSTNTKDSIMNGTFKNPNIGKTHCKHGHELSGSNLYIYKDKKTKRMHRWCRICRARHNNKSI